MLAFLFNKEVGLLFCSLVILCSARRSVRERREFSAERTLDLVHGIPAYTNRSNVTHSNTVYGIHRSDIKSVVSPILADTHEFRLCSDDASAVLSPVEELATCAQIMCPARVALCLDTFPWPRNNWIRMTGGRMSVHKLSRTDTQLLAWFKHSVRFLWVGPVNCC